MSDKETMQTQIALLRGINLGGTNRLPMKDLTRIFAEAGGQDVTTWLQSGNVIFRATPLRMLTVVETVAETISDQFGLQVPIITRNLDEMERVVQANPFLKEEKIELKTLHVSFLRDHPDTSRIESLATDRSPPDRFQIMGRDIFLHLPTGVARSKLTNQYFDSKLRTISTMRNWKTVLKLLEIGSDY